jgi:hypothetical protein
MCSRILVVTAARLLAPLGTRAADLVVWCEEGTCAEEGEAVREIIAGFEQETGNQLGRYCTKPCSAGTTSWARPQSSAPPSALAMAWG